MNWKQLTYMHDGKEYKAKRWNLQVDETMYISVYAFNEGYKYCVFGRVSDVVYKNVDECKNNALQVAIGKIENA